MTDVVQEIVNQEIIGDLDTVYQSAGVMSQSQ